MLEDLISNAIAGSGGGCQAGEKSNAGLLGGGVGIGEDALDSAAAQGELLVGVQGGGPDGRWGLGSNGDCDLHQQQMVTRQRLDA